MPPFGVKRKRTHQENCLVVCAVCLRKCSNIREVTKDTEKLIQDLVYGKYCLESFSLPKGVCASCRFALVDVNKVSV